MVTNLPRPSWRNKSQSLLIFTDLDGTLLDHDSYCFDAATSTLSKLQHAGIDVIFVTSKTALEVRDLQKRLKLNTPFAVENGAAICIPPHSPFASGQRDSMNLGNERWHIALFGLDYPSICQRLCQIRNQQQFRFQGFSDMSDEELQRHTGLSAYQAKLAKQRLASEPILWNDSEKNLQRFKQQLKQFDLELIKGGRFYHVKAPFDKADAMAWLTRAYSETRAVHVRSIALGDSENDRRMLDCADHAIVIPRKHQPPLQLERAQSILAPYPGPSGWSRAVEQLLNNTTQE